MLRINVDDKNTPEYWDEVYQKESGTKKRRLDPERLEFVAQAIRRWASKNGNNLPKFADLGCGSGELIRWLHYEFPEMKQTGVDISEWGIQYGDTNTSTKHIKFIEGDLNREIPLQPHSQGVIFCGETIEHLKDPDTAIYQMIDKLEPNGLLVLSLPNRDYNPDPEHNFIFTLWDVLKLGNKYGTVEYLDALCRGISICAIIKKGEPDESA